MRRNRKLGAITANILSTMQKKKKKNQDTFYMQILLVTQKPHEKITIKP